MGQYNIGVYGLGVMGKSIAKNMINNKFKVSLFSKSEAERKGFKHNVYNDNWKVFDSEEDFVLSLEKPRVIFLMITAGKPVDLVIESLLGLIDKGDIIVDGGNSYFKDTIRRIDYLKEKEVEYLGIGVSGGEQGALYGPSMMAGGSKKAWESSNHIFKLIAANFKDEVCCDYVGESGAGHYVKMVHNGIEYAILQCIADIYHIMDRGFKLSVDKMAEIFKSWENSELSSYLINITSEVLAKKDDDGEPLIYKISDCAKQKGTGAWTVQEGIERGVYIPTIYEAVAIRSFSQKKEARKKGSEILKYSIAKFEMENFEEKLKNALYASIICSYAQGIELIKKASEDYNFNIDIKKTIGLWRNGCIIRSDLLQKITASLTDEPDASNIILSKEFGILSNLQEDLREVLCLAREGSLSVAAIDSCLLYYDSYHTEYMQLNLVQGLRDYFGAHTYERIDKDGAFHTKW